jgi:hypothetical protein
MADIARAVLAVQCKLPSLDDNEFTVLAAIVAEDMGSGVVQVLSLATERSAAARLNMARLENRAQL